MKFECLLSPLFYADYSILKEFDFPKVDFKLRVWKIRWKYLITDL